METKKNKTDGVLTVPFNGRLDAQGAKHLEHDLNDYLRRGQHHILLNLQDTEFISSAGIRILLVFRKKLSAIDGSFKVKVSDQGNVREVLQLSGLKILIADDQELTPEQQETRESFTKEKICFDIMERRQGGFSQSIIGSSEKLHSGTFSPEDAKDLTFPKGTLAIGIGALGKGYDNCCQQFGEFMALGGAALSRPPGSTEIDYILTQEKVIPEACLLCGLKFEGDFDTIFRFAPQNENNSLPLNLLCREAMELAKTDSIVLVAAVEVADIVGAALAKSPAEKTADENIFTFPGIRDWLTFTGEPVHKGTTALITGITSRNKNSLKNKFLNSLGDNIYGMFKAGIFSYGPLSRDQKDLSVITEDIFERHKPIDLLHLINDQRTLLGVGQSHFLRGTVWTGKISSET